MTKQLKEIEIPFRAKDSELYGWEYTIPEGMEATIVDNKIVVKKKESKDERIRKALLNEFIHLQSKSYKFAGLEGEEIVAWLEKQGEKKSLNDIAKEVIKDKDTAISFLKSCGIINENGELADEYKIEQSKQNPTDKVEPKFKVGDWIVYNRNDSSREILYVYDIRDGRYYFNDNIHFSWSVKECDEKCHLWTIDDVKSGDVVANDHHILILKELDYDWSSNGTPNSVKAYCGIKPNGNFEIGKDNWCFCGTLHIHPASKEERNLLFAKMHEAGYEWDDIKKELEEIEDEPENFKQQVMSEMCNLVKDYIQQESAEWSEEDEKMLKWLCRIVHFQRVDNVITLKEESELGQWMDKWLNHSPQSHWKPAEWNEEDEKERKRIIGLLEGWLSTFKETCYAEDCKCGIDWLKSIKDRVHPQNTWKPSDKQMNTFEQWLKDNQYKGDARYCYPIFESLYDDLKKLREE